MCLRPVERGTTEGRHPQRGRLEVVVGGRWARVGGLVLVLVLYTPVAVVTRGFNGMGARRVVRSLPSMTGTGNRLRTLRGRGRGSLGSVRSRFRHGTSRCRGNTDAVGTATGRRGRARLRNLRRGVRRTCRSNRRRLRGGDDRLVRPVVTGMHATVRTMNGTNGCACVVRRNATVCANTGIMSIAGRMRTGVGWSGMDVSVGGLETNADTYPCLSSDVFVSCVVECRTL